MVRQQYKIRIIQKGGGTTTFGIAIPQSMRHWFGISVIIRESGGSLILESGAQVKPITDKELSAYIIKREFIKI